jgi:DNA-directed RNA polymerase specialized sigma24 family protein
MIEIESDARAPAGATAQTPTRLDSADRMLRGEPVAFRLAYLLVRDADRAAWIAAEGLIVSAVVGEEKAFSAFRTALLRAVIAAAPEPPPTRRRSPAAMRQLPASIAAVRGVQNREVLGAITRLRRSEQLVLYLRVFLDLDSDEAAEVLGCTAGEAQARMHAAIAALGAAVNARAALSRGGGTLPALETALRAAAESFPYPPTAAVLETVSPRLLQPVAPGNAARPPAAVMAMRRRWWSLLVGLTVVLTVLILVAVLRLR